MNQERARKEARLRLVKEAGEEARRQVGVLLPNTDPTVGEMVLTTFMANPGADVALLLAALAREAPTPELAAELVKAGMELTVCRLKGQVVWVGDKAGDYLVGIRRLADRDAISVGGRDWPMLALVEGPPQAVVVRTSRGPRHVWAACSGLDGQVLRASEVYALGAALVERWGGRVIEDRQGPEVMHQSFVEGNMTRRAKARAEATAALERMAVEGRGPGARRDHARVALAEAYPGSLQVGTLLHPEGEVGPAHVFEVERRVSDDYVLAVAVEPGPAHLVEACVWVVQGRLDQGDAAFSEDRAELPEPPLPLGIVARRDLAGRAVAGLGAVVAVAGGRATAEGAAAVTGEPEAADEDGRQADDAGAAGDGAQGPAPSAGARCERCGWDDFDGDGRHAPGCPDGPGPGAAGGGRAPGPGADHDPEGDGRDDE